MKWVSIRRPSASMVVSLIALVIAASGTAIAAGTASNGDKLIKKHSLSGNRLRNHTLTGKQINLNKLGKVPSAHSADIATNATNAANAAKLGGLAPAAFQANLPWALLDSDGTILAQSGGISLLGGFSGGVGAYVGFPEHLKGVVVTGAYTGADFAGRGTPIAELCGGGGGKLVNCSVGPNDTTEAFVRTFNADNATGSPHPFVIIGLP